MSSSSEASLLWTREAPREFVLEFGRELALDDCFDLALLEVVLPLSRARLLRSSCIVAKLTASSNRYSTRGRVNYTVVGLGRSGNGVVSPFRSGVVVEM